MKLIPIIAAMFLIAACGDSDSEASPESITLLTHDSFALSDGVLETFTSETGVEVDLLQPGDAVEITNRALLTAGNPEADVLFGIDNNVLSRALEEDLFVAHEAEGLDGVPDELELDPEHRVTPIDIGDVCINYDVGYFEGRDLEPPADLDDLIDPAYEGLLVVENPSVSTPGLAFMLATIARYGTDGWADWWEALRGNGVLVENGWSEAYYGAFTVGSGGTGNRPIVVSYASSPPAEVFFAETPPETAPTAVLDESCYRQIEFAGILRGTEHAEAAGELIDFMLTETYQADLPLNQFVFPAVADTPLPEVFVEHAELVGEPLSIQPEEIDENREQWVQTWTDIVLR